MTPDPTRSMARLLRPAASALIAAAWLAGCSSDTGVLARVRGHAITVEQFNEVARGNATQITASPDSAKARLLKDLIDRELLVQGALAAHLDQTPDYQAYRARLEDQVLREALYQRLLGGPFPVSQAETRELYERRATATRVRLIFAFDPGFIRQAEKDLARGDDFAVVADRYNPTGMVPPGGDTGFLQPGALLPPLDDIVRTGTLHKVYGPLAAGSEGWFIVRIEERKPVPQPAYEQASAQLGEMLRQRKQRAAFAHVYDQLKTEYQVTVVPGAAQYMATRLRAAPGAAPTPQPPAPPSGEERRHVLARFTGGAYTLGEAYDDLVGGASGRLDLSVTASVARWLESQAVERAAVVEARRRRIGDEPAVQRRLRERLNNFLLDGYYQREVVGRITIEPEDFRAAYEQYRGSLARLTGAHVAALTLADSAQAATIANQARTAANLRDAATRAGVGARLSDENPSFPSDSPVWTQFENHVLMMQPGEVAGPFQVQGGWLTFQLLEKQQDAPPFEALTPTARAQLQGVATEMKREARLLAVTDSLRQAFGPVVVYTDRLRRIPWPPAATGPGS